jgi:hypothetical protein
MGINKNNYEAYLLDLWEGNLSEDDQVLLSQFLEMHPELEGEDDLNLLEDISIIDSNVIFDKASIQFDHINLQNYEFFFVAFIEGDLSQEEMMEVNAFLIEHPTLSEKFTQFKKTKLPLETILYPHKEKLLFKAPILLMPARRRLMFAVAASIVFIFWISSPFQNDAYKYSVTPTGKKDVNTVTVDNLLDEAEKQKTNLILDESDNRLAVQNPLSPSNKEKESKQHKIKEGNLNNSSPAQKENTIPYRKEEQIARIEIQTYVLPNPAVLNVAAEKIDEQMIANNSPYVKQENPTIRDLTASYLQRKNVLNDERKADLKGILNTTFSSINPNNEPVFASTEESNKKTTLFQLGGLKVERKTTK